jgi:hypothetical protein
MIIMKFKKKFLNCLQTLYQQHRLLMMLLAIKTMEFKLMWKKN